MKSGLHPAPRRAPVASRSALALAVALLAAGTAPAEPWIAPGDVTLRHDLQMLADLGYLSGPTLSWPIAWSKVATELRRIDQRKLGVGQLQVVRRMLERAGEATRTHDAAVTGTLRGALEPSQIRTFEDTPREEAEAGVAVSWVGERFAARGELTVVADPDDSQDVRPDGSYVAAALGNWRLSAGYLPRWWGPGWEGSLILSTNARPVASLGLDRNEPNASALPVLRWLGPWTMSTFMGRLESDRDYPNALLWGLRGEIRPLPSLQLGASRTAQWCGDGRPCGLDTFWDLVVGNDNDQSDDEQPGNQLAGFDARWSWPGGRVPLALYGQAIGEDEAGFMPSKYMGLVGLEGWGQVGAGTWRVHAEYADTACDVFNSEPIYGCAYVHSIYTTGYRYRGRALGHTLDGDGRSTGVAATYIAGDGQRWTLGLRDADINRKGAIVGHTLSVAPAEWSDARLSYERAGRWGNITVSVGYAWVDGLDPLPLDDGPRAEVSWRVDAR